MLKRLKNSDLFFLEVFNNSIKCRPLDIIMPLVTYLGSATFTILFCVSLILFPKVTSRTLGMYCLLSLSLSELVAFIIKHTVNRMRPYIKFPDLNIRKIGIDDYSFPSGHTTAAFSIAIMISLFYTPMAFISVPLATLVGISRMYLGVHYPSDVMIGILLGALSSFMIFTFI